MEKMYLDFYLMLGTKVNSRLISGLSVKDKIIFSGKIDKNKARTQEKSL